MLWLFSYRQLRYVNVLNIWCRIVILAAEGNSAFNIIVVHFCLVCSKGFVFHNYPSVHSNISHIQIISESDNSPVICIYWIWSLILSEKFHIQFLFNTLRLEKIANMCRHCQLHFLSRHILNTCSNINFSEVCSWRLTVSQLWFWQWHGAKQMTNHYLSQWCPYLMVCLVTIPTVTMRIYL